MNYIVVHSMIGWIIYSEDRLDLPEKAEYETSNVIMWSKYADLDADHFLNFLVCKTVFTLSHL